MKANELMIGDWVRIQYRERNVRVTCVQNNGLIETSSVSPLREDEFKPIPLTVETLEKNGWKKEFDKKPYMTSYHLEDEKYWLMWCISEHTLDIQRQNKTLLDQYNLCAERVVIACEYVHQLQHALRLCGIDKEIIL